MYALLDLAKSALAKSLLYAIGPDDVVLDNPPAQGSQCTEVLLAILRCFFPVILMHRLLHLQLLNLQLVTFGLILADGSLEVLCLSCSERLRVLLEVLV